MIPTLSGEASSLARCLDLARDWLHRAFLRTAAGEVGWGHYLGEQEPTVWGGTLDGIRAMAQLGEPPLSPDLTDAVAWLRSQQRPDGGYGTREMQYSAAEATAWVVITLARLGLTAANDHGVRQALGYLEQCVDAHGGAATTPADFDQPRTLPTALVLWALSTQPGTGQVRGVMIDRLRAMRDPETWGWGVSFGAAPNAANTAQVLHALREAGVSPESEWMREGARYLVSRQESNGSWRNSHDEWFTKATPKVPYRCVHFATAWALLALMHFDDRACRLAAARAARFLVSQQRHSGAWLFEEFDPTEHVWCTTQIVVALALWKERQEPARDVDPVRGQVSLAWKGGSDLAVRSVGWLRRSILYFVVAALVVAQFGAFFGAQIDRALNALHIDRAGVWTNIVSAALWAGIVVLAGVATKRIIRGKERGDR